MQLACSICREPQEVPSAVISTTCSRCVYQARLRKQPAREGV